MKAFGIVAAHGEALGFATGSDEVLVVFYGYGYGYGYASLCTAYGHAPCAAPC